MWVTKGIPSWRGRWQTAWTLMVFRSCLFSPFLPLKVKPQVWINRGCYLLNIYIKAAMCSQEKSHILVGWEYDKFVVLKITWKMVLKIPGKFPLCFQSILSPIFNLNFFPQQSYSSDFIKSVPSGAELPSHKRQKIEVAWLSFPNLPDSYAAFKGFGICRSSSTRLFPWQRPSSSCSKIILSQPTHALSDIVTSFTHPALHRLCLLAFWGPVY